jgi:predicted aspartyl protease
MTTLQRSYQPFGISEVPAPVIEIVLKDLLGNNPVKINALLDTGYDGYLIVPPTIYERVGLSKYELDLDMVPPLETVGGERIIIRSSNGLVHIEGFSDDILCEIDSHATCIEALIGRQLLAIFCCTLDGPSELLSLELGNSSV